MATNHLSPQNAAHGDSNSFSPHHLLAVEDSLGKDSFLKVFETESAKDLFPQFVQDVESRSRASGHTVGSKTETETEKKAQEKNHHLRSQSIRLGIAALGAFLQTNVTGPVLESTGTADTIILTAFRETWPKPEDAHTNGKPGREPEIEYFRRLCQRSLDTDGVSVYSYIPHIELFCLARFIFTSGVILPAALPSTESDPDYSLSLHLSWTRLRIHLWHYKLLTRPSLGPGSLFTKSGRWTDVATLQELIEKSLVEAEVAVSTTVRTEDGKYQYAWPQESRIQFRLEEAHCHILLGNDTKARQALQAATQISGFTYALSGALGKRTKFQEKSISQLVVLAKSQQLKAASTSEEDSSRAAPVALPLNDDTLLENIEFNRSKDTDSTSPTNTSGTASSLPTQLQDVTPENQPELRPEDQIILLTEATLKDTFSPADTLTSEEILPFAVRVVEDKAANWQIYTQALLVRSRIELNRSRTIERGVLQMQAVVDQVIVDTQAPNNPTQQPVPEGGSSIPAISVADGSQAGSAGDSNKPTSFLPAPKPSESASPSDRLRYVNALASPPRWHLESELAYAWTAVGSLVSALEIFKRLRLWAEVALCLATAGASSDEDGRGGGGEDKARAVVRWRLFHRTSDSNGTTTSMDDGELDREDVDISSLRASEFCGPERSPPPPNAPRLLCILGDMENDAQHYRRAWEVSKRRFARAQRSLGELHLQRQEWKEALEAYKLAVGVNRLSPDMWSRLGDIELRLGHFPDAAESFQRAISTANDSSGGDDARTWSNLGGALLSWYREVVQESKARQDKLRNEEPDMLEDMASTKRAADLGRPAYKLLGDSLAAFKRGATIANSNWKIWDNVVTLAASLAPEPDLDDVVLGMRNIIRIRKTEEALDLEILTLLVREATKIPIPASEESTEIYQPMRGTIENKIVALFEDEIVPLVTTNSACWSLVSRLRAWRRDWVGALDAAEKGWRAAIGGVGSALSASSAHGQQGSWLADADEWDVVVQRTSELVAAYENYGSRLDSIGPKWKGKARSAIRSVMGKAKESWEGDDRWTTLQDMMEDLKI